MVCLYISTSLKTLLTCAVTALSEHGQYGRSWMLAAIQAHQVSDRAQLNPRSELTAYLKSPLEQIDDVVGWWGVSIYIEQVYS